MTHAAFPFLGLANFALAATPLFAGLIAVLTNFTA